MPKVPKMNEFYLFLTVKRLVYGFRNNLYGKNFKGFYP